MLKFRNINSGLQSVRHRYYLALLSGPEKGLIGDGSGTKLTSPAPLLFFNVFLFYFITNFTNNFLKLNIYLHCIQKAIKKLVSIEIGATIQTQRCESQQGNGCSN